MNASTKERIGFPRHYVGRIGTVNRLGSAGLIVTHALQIEPGFKGHVHFFLFNAGASPFRLCGHDLVISLEILRLSAAPIFTTI